MILYDPRAANAPSPRMRRAKTPFARFSCTKTAICAGAVNHPHHINPMNHSSDKCQRTLVHALTPVNPFHPPPKGLQPNPYPPASTTRAAFASRPSAVMRPRLFCPISRKRSCNARISLVRALLPVNPSIRRQRPSSAARTRPPRPRARPSPATRLPSCAQISCPISHILSQSLVISRASRLPVIPFNRPKKATNVNPVCNRDAAGHSNNCVVAVSPALTQYEIRNSAPNLLLPPCKSLDHRIRCTHSRKSKATADHLCTLTNVYCLTEHTQLQDHSAAAPDATRCAHPQNFFGESKATHEFTRQFAPLRANSILTPRPDRIQSRASHEFMPRFDPLCACALPAQLMRHCAPPAATTPAAFTQPPVCRDASIVF